MADSFSRWVPRAMKQHPVPSEESVVPIQHPPQPQLFVSANVVSRIAFFTRNITRKSWGSEEPMKPYEHDCWCGHDVGIDKEPGPGDDDAGFQEHDVELEFYDESGKRVVHAPLHLS